ncbi:MAG: hypothetical protein ACLPIC_11985 [Rhodoblastus sp.]|uniref:hypothetical protein n=1 Tax=Rhodoblastus sp. TaxID=1962975 RepID=UPI003F9DB98E
MVKKTAPLTPKLVADKGLDNPAGDMPTQDPAAGDAAVPAPSKAAKTAKPAVKTVKSATKPAAKTAAKPAKSEKPAKLEKTEKIEKPAKVAKKPLNFKVPADFRREFKTYASTHDLKLNRLLELAFESYRKQRGD